MAYYEILWKGSVTKDLKKLPKGIIGKIINKIEKLKKDPLPEGCVKIRTTKTFYRLRVGDYRIVYQVDKPGKRVIIYYIRHRKDIYKKFKK